MDLVQLSIVYVQSSPEVSQEYAEVNTINTFTLQE